MTEKNEFRSQNTDAEENMKSLMRGIDLQIWLMSMIRNQLDTYVKTDNINGMSGFLDISQTAEEGGKKPIACEFGSRYGKAGFMADVELDEKGEIASIHYDWVEP